jgi:hypothetical protein
MAIGQSKLHEMMRRRLLLSESLVWVNTFDSNLKLKILDWIRDDQLTQRGVDSDGDIIGLYSLTTSFINPRKSFNTHFTLNDTGDFYRSMFVKVFLDRILIDANSNSFSEMTQQEWFTDKILGLTDGNIELLRIEVKKGYTEAIRKALLRD